VCVHTEKFNDISTPHQQTHLFIKSFNGIAQILLLLCIDHPFCSDHFNPFKSFFLLWNWTVTSTRPDVKRWPNVKTSKLLLQCFISSQVSGGKKNPIVLDLDFLRTSSPNNFFFPIAKIHIRRLFTLLQKSSHLISNLPKSIKENSPQFPKFTLFTHSCKNLPNFDFLIKEKFSPIPKVHFYSHSCKKTPLNLIFQLPNLKKKTASKGTRKLKKRPRPQRVYMCL
jgi:hypothetical protein